MTTNLIRRTALAAPISTAVAAISLLGFLGYQIVGVSNAQWFTLQTGDMSAPLHWYRFLTYSFVPAIALHWIWNSALLVLVGMVIEKRLTKSYVLSTIVASSVLGGLLICTFSRIQTIFFGMGFITNAYIGCLFACYLADKDKLRKPERLLAGVLLILKLVHLGVGLAWIKYGMNSALLKCVILVASFLMTWKMYGTASRFVSDRRTNERRWS